MTATADTRRPRRIVVAIGVAITYAAAALLSLQLAPAPDRAAPLFFGAGLALACALRYGWPALAGVLIGGVGAVLLSRGVETFAEPRLTAIWSVIQLGVMLQAGVGKALVRRFLPGPLTLSTPRDIALFLLLGAPVACLISASFSGLVLFATGVVTGEALAAHWLIWWTGDTLGVLIGAPIVLSVIGRPSADWKPRRLTLGLPLAFLIVVLATATSQVTQWQNERSRTLFEREASQAVALFKSNLEESVHALQVLRGAFAIETSPAPNALRRAARNWIADDATRQAASSNVWSLGVAQWVANGNASEAVSGADSDSARGAQAGVASGRQSLVVRDVEPAASKEPARGSDLLSIETLRDAVERSIRTDTDAASAGFSLNAVPGGSPAVAVVHALFADDPRTPGERLTERTGVVFVTLVPQFVLDRLEGVLPAAISLCLVDTDPRAAHRELAGGPGCKRSPAFAWLTVRDIVIAGRSWQIRASASPLSLRVDEQAGTIAVSLVSLLATAMLGALLLTVTGQTRRIESAVQARTVELEREIDERAVTEAALRESEQRFRNIFDNAPIGVVYADLDGNVLQANPRFCEMLGYSAQALANMNVSDFVPPADRHDKSELVRTLLRIAPASDRAQRRYLSANGRTLWVQRSFSLLRDAQGVPQCLVGVVEDITEHLRLQDAERAREVAEQSNRAKSEFLSRMSHELRTPLNAMLGFAQLLELDENHPLTDAQRPWVAQIQNAGWHLLEMINDVLDLSRIEAGTMRLQPETLALAPLIDATVALIEGAAERRGIAVTRQVDDEAARVHGDATRVKQILTNLLSNAVKYNHDNGRIHIEALARGDAQVEITVTDTGLGMTAEQIGGLFQPFNRLGREQTVREGTGIGLVISRRLAELMGGTLRVRSRAGDGSSFVLALPKATDDDTVPSRLDEPYTTSSGYQRRVVHYVEDNETNVEVMRGILSQRPQVQFQVSMTGLDALAAMRQKHPDLVLLDMHLPDVDGMELLRHLKADADLADVPVVVVSADAMPAQVEAALAAGALRYLTKPVSVAAVLATLDELLDRVPTQFG